jgi:hypothetical protein
MLRTNEVKGNRVLIEFTSFLLLDKIYPAAQLPGKRPRATARMTSSKMMMAAATMPRAMGTAFS